MEPVTKKVVEDFFQPGTFGELLIRLVGREEFDGVIDKALDVPEGGSCWHQEQGIVEGLRHAVHCRLFEAAYRKATEETMIDPGEVKEATEGLRIEPDGLDAVLAKLRAGLTDQDVKNLRASLKTAAESEDTLRAFAQNAGVFLRVLKLLV